MGEVDVLKAQVVRRDVNEPWGFRLQGGSDVGQPLTIIRVCILLVLWLWWLLLFIFRQLLKTALFQTVPV